jgi:taurine dioxygenase
MKVTPTGEILGATVEGIDLARMLGPADFRTILNALGEHGVLRFPRQLLDAAQLKAFAARFGSLEINVAGAYQEPGHPEVMILSNIVENGRPIGARATGSRPLFRGGRRNAAL